MHQALLTLGFGLVAAAILALSALAFTLEYSVTNVANLSHGEILTVGAYCAYLVQQHGGGAILAITTTLLRRLPRYERPHRLDFIGAIFRARRQRAGG